MTTAQCTAMGRWVRNGTSWKLANVMACLDVILEEIIVVQGYKGPP
jgi:hypothetical protein